MQLGGPVWHASAAPAPGALFAGVQSLRSRALAALDGVGDASLGQWEEWTGRAFHIRRRLTPVEQAPVGDVVDIRGTPEVDRRLAPVRHMLPPGWTED